jgi:two-component system phosphate regulon sensor histidine kinase PhoR
VRFPAANDQLRRAQLVLLLATLLPTVLMTGVGIILLVLGSGSASVVSGILVLTFCTAVITGSILGSVFLGKGASLARLQNDFTSAVSHELRTPVTSIRLLMESLRDNRITQEDRDQALALLSRESERLELLVNRVLDLSKLQSRNHAWKRDPVDMQELAEEAIQAFDAHTLSRPTPIALDLERGLVLTGDRPMLVRALVNLLHNAWKYTGDDKQIAIAAHRAGRRIEVVVRDNGIGIDPSEKKSIYEQFRRGRSAYESGAPGMGLGLAFVRAIVRGHRGKLDFESQPGSTAFRIRLKNRRESAIAESVAT